MNILPNSTFGICTGWRLYRVGNPINITDWYSVQPGIVGFHTPQAQSGYCEGLIPGKLVLVEGAGTQNVNGLPVGGDPTEPNVIGYPLKVVQTVAGTLVCTLAGAVVDPGPSVSCTAWEVCPADETLDGTGGPDGWKKYSTLQAWRQYLTDADRRSTVMPGCDYSVKLRKNTSATELFYAELNPRELAGKTITFGSFSLPASGTTRLFIFDGQTWSYSPFFYNSGFNWVEVTKTIGNTPDRLWIGYSLDGAPNDVTWVTQPIARYGATPIGNDGYRPTRGLHVFTTHPNFNRNYVDGSVASDRVIRIEQESLGKLPSGLKAIHIGFEGKNSISGQWCEITTDETENIPSLTCYSQISNAVIVNSGLAAIGHFSEIYPTEFKSDSFKVKVSSPWTGVNIDMFACEL